MVSKLITKNNLLEFVLGLYGIPDPVLCVWATTQPPTQKMTDGGEIYDLDNALIFIKEDVETIFLPKGIEPGAWNLVLLCLKYKHEPVLGWLMGSTPDNFMSFTDDMISDLDPET